MTRLEERDIVAEAIQLEAAAIALRSPDPTLKALATRLEDDPTLAAELAEAVLDTLARYN